MYLAFVWINDTTEKAWEAFPLGRKQTARTTVVCCQTFLATFYWVQVDRSSFSGRPAAYLHPVGLG
jgi:hypothetical protein